MVRIPLDIVATASGHRTKGVLVGVMAADLDALEAVSRAVVAACHHDRDCEKEGEGECCYLAWRAVAVLAGEATNLTSEEQKLLLADARKAVGGEGHASD